MRGGRRGLLFLFPQKGGLMRGGGLIEDLRYRGYYLAAWRYEIFSSSVKIIQHAKRNIVSPRGRFSY